MPDDEISLYLHIYSDGIGIFTLVDKKEECVQDDYKAENTLNIRKKCHGELLTFNHLFSDLIDRHINKIRSFFDENKKRFTASSDWENRGLSYILSFYFINCDITLLEKESFQEKLVYLLFPFYSGYDYDFDYFSLNDIESELVRKKTEN